MGYRFDWLVADLRCLACGAVSEAFLQSSLRPDPQLADLRVGAPLGLLDGPNDGYYPVRPVQGGTWQLLETWDCKVCGTRQWAAVNVRKDRLEDIQTVALTQETLEQAHYVSFEAQSHVEPPFLKGAELVQALREQLPSGGSAQP
ncbi:MAG: hypothetical protein ACI9VR_004559 [Cognaticolwellia sp.]|jgi:hypothetical protein